MDDWYGLNRTLCDVFHEMRKCFKTFNFSPIKGLIEEAQSYANRMEAALSDQRDFIELSEKVRVLRKEFEILKKEKEILEPKKEEDA